MGEGGVGVAGLDSGGKRYQGPHYLFQSVGG